MQPMRLDREKNAPIPAGYTLVVAEVEFLKLATGQQPLQIRGDKLCAWAQTFFEARKILYQEVQSYSQELCHSLPELSTAEAVELATILAEKLEDLERPLQVASLLNTVYPSSLWYEKPSVKHLSQWLLWIEQTDIHQDIYPLLKLQVAAWQNEDMPFGNQVYQISTRETAHHALSDWLGIADRNNFPLRQEFQGTVPESYHHFAREKWRGQILESRGVKIEQLVRQKIPNSLKQIAAEEAFTVFLNNPDFLKPHYIELLTQFITGNKLAKLRELLPPLAPSTMPENPSEVVQWFAQEYLPYREWQRFTDSENGRLVALQAARQFELWYLENYPRALFGGSLQNWLSFNKVNKINCPPTCLTLLIILDGMHVADSRTLLQNVLNQTQRLAVTATEFVFAPIPTVTEFAKEALLKGVPPNRTEAYSPLGTILSQRVSPAQRLQNAECGKVYIWRVLEPDDTYHHNNHSENLLQDVEGRLKAEALKIKDIVDNIPDHVTLQIILATDHGRLLSESHKTIPVPSGMESHGRAAWGQSPIPLMDVSYIVNDGVAYLRGESYGMLSDVAIPLDDGAFRKNNNNEGTEIFPHGGLFPEEVIIPWIVLARDLEQPDADIRIIGSGRARREGAFQVEIINKSDVSLIVESVSIVSKKGLAINLPASKHIRACSSEKLPFSYSPWPSASDAATVSASVQMRLPNGMKFEYIAEIKISSDDFQMRTDDSIFEDMN